MALQTSLIPGEGFAGPVIETERFVSFDGARLGLTRWTTADEPKAVIVGLHGMNDYANAFHLAAPVWAAQGIATYAYDQRGFGRSPQRGVWAGEDLMAADLRVFVSQVRAMHPGVPLVVAGESMGAAAAICAFASDRPPDADRLVLLAPAVWGWSQQALPNKTALWVAARLSPATALSPPGFIAEQYVPTDNYEERVAMSRDRLLLFTTRPDAVYGLVDLMESAHRRLSRVKAPTAYLYGAKDVIVPQAATLSAVKGLKKTDRSAYYPNGYHLLMKDRDRALVLADVASFVLDPDAPLPSGLPVIPGAPTRTNRSTV